MKIIQDSRRILQIQHKTLSPFFLTLFGTPFFIIGIIVILLGEKTTLNCQKIDNNQNSCQLTKVSLYKTKIETVPGSIIRAKVDVNEDSDGDTYRVILITSKQEIPLTSMYSSGSKNKRVNKNKINNFLQNSNQISLTVTQDDRFFLYPFGSIFFLTGGGVILGALIFGDLEKLFTLKRTTQKFEIKRQKILKNVQQQYSFSEIDRFVIKTETDSDGDKTYTLQLKLHSGRLEPLYSNALESKLQNIAKKMNNFIGKLESESK